MTQRQYVYRIAQVVKVSDGDTYHLKVDAGFHHEVFITCRLLGYDCPERTRGSDFEKAEARRATEAAAWWFQDSPTDGPIWVRTEKDPDSFGRWLGHIWVGDNEDDSLGDFLRLEGLASVYPTRWREEYDQEALVASGSAQQQQPKVSGSTGGAKPRKPPPGGDGWLDGEPHYSGPHHDCVIASAHTHRRPWIPNG